jgi:hypothetical protein
MNDMTDNESLVLEIRQLRNQVTNEIGQMRNEIGQMRFEIGQMRNEIGQMRQDIETVNFKITELGMRTMPTMDESFKRIPVIDAGTVDACSLNGKNSTWTWFDYGSKGIVIVGAAHCAIPLVFPGKPHDLFINLPTSIICLGIHEVLLIDPYDYSFKSPLPVEKDLIVIRVCTAPPLGTNVPCYTRLTPKKKRNMWDSKIVGRGLEHAVQSYRDAICITTDEKARGIVRFSLSLGEPGDSGTLLFALDPAELRYHAIGVFRGTEPLAGKRVLPRGCGALLPPFDTLECLPVKPGPHPEETLEAYCKDERVLVRVTNPSPGISELELSNGLKFRGVFVATKQQVSYDGYSQICSLRGTNCL